MVSSQLLGVVEEVWRIPKANMLISIDAGSSHPTLLATKDLCASKAYENWAQEGRQQVEKSQLLRRQSEEQRKGGEQDRHKGGEQDQLLMKVEMSRRLKNAQRG